jgi:thymidylate synthase ThyX
VEEKRPVPGVLGRQEEERVVSDYVEPRVWLVGRPQVDATGINSFLKEIRGALPKSVVGVDPRSAWSDDNHWPGEQLDELAGRVDYFSFSDERRRPGGIAAYFDRIVGERHLNVVEIGHWNFTVQCSIGVAAEVLRYRTMERSQTSSRYIPYDEVPEVRVPWYHYPLTDGGYSQWRRNYTRDYDHWFAQGQKLGYKGTDLRKFARSMAGGHVPRSAATWLVLAANAASMRNMFEQGRATRHAHPEFRCLAVQWYGLMLVEAPHLLADFDLRADPVDGLPCVVRKVQGSG